MNFTLHCRTFFAVVLLFLSGYHTVAQLHNFRLYSQKDGLIADGVIVMIQDDRGYLWIGTEEGLNIFDGISFSKFTERDGLPSNTIFAFCESKLQPGVMWIGTHRGLVRHTENRFETILMSDDKDPLRVTSIAEDASGRLWCATSKGIYTLRDSTVTIVPLPDSLKNLHRITRGIDGSIFVGCHRGVLTYSPVPGDTAPPALRLIHLVEPLSNLFVDNTNGIWVSTFDDMLYYFHEGKLVKKKRHPAERISQVGQDMRGVFWAGCRKGILSFTRQQFLDGTELWINEQNRFPGFPIKSIAFDREGNLWMALIGSGLLKLSRESVSGFPVSNVYPAYNNGRAASDSSGNIWVISGNSLQEFWKNNENRWITAIHSLGDKNDRTGIQFVLNDRKNRLWVLHPVKGIQCYAIRSRKNQSSTLIPLKKIRFPIENSPVLISCFIIDRNDRVWWSLDQVGIIVYDHVSDTILHHFKPADAGIPSPDIRTLLEDSKGNIWIGGISGGVAVVPEGDYAKPFWRITTDDGLPEGYIRSFMEDSQGRMWIGTRWGGCAVVENRQVITTILTMDGLNSNVIWTMARDSTGALLMGTSLGPQRVNPATLKPMPTWNRFTMDPVNGIGTLRDGTIWFLTRDMLHIVQPEKFNESPFIPGVHISKLEINEQPVVITDTLYELSYDQNNCTISYNAVLFQDGHTMKYRYRLIGIDDQWHQPADQRSVTYASLLPGMYTFEVQSMLEGIPSPDPPAAIRFTILPPFWARWWFLFSAGCVILGVLTIVYRMRIARLKKDEATQKEFSKRLLLSQEEERSRIAGELHDSLVQNLLIAKNHSLLGVKKSTDAGDTANTFKEITSAIGDSIEEVRQISHNLRPYQLDRLGLTMAIRALIDQVNAAKSIVCTLDADTIDGLFPKEYETFLYRIIQESVNNILKHAQATTASLVIRKNGNTLQLCIEDNGIGFPKDSNGMTKGFGMSGIEHRVSILGGELSMSNGRERGTQLTITVPLPDQA